MVKSRLSVDVKIMAIEYYSYNYILYFSFKNGYFSNLLFK